MSDAGARTALIEMVGRVPNVALLAATPAKAAFAPGQFDFVLLHRVDPGDTAFIGKVFAAVRPGGIVGYVGDPHARGGAAETVTPAFAAAGFVVDATSRLVAPPGDGDDDPADRIVVRLLRPE
jgi:predicted methyltransferase